MHRPRKQESTEESQQTTSFYGGNERIRAGRGRVTRSVLAAASNEPLASCSLAGTGRFAHGRLKPV